MQFYHYIRLDFLEQVVLGEIHSLTQFANEYDDDLIKAIAGHSAKVVENELARKHRELDALRARDRELDSLFERRYEDNVSSMINDDLFSKMFKRYEQEQGENAKKIKALREELRKRDTQQMDMDVFLETVRRYTGDAKLTRHMVLDRKDIPELNILMEKEKE